MNAATSQGAARLFDEGRACLVGLLRSETASASARIAHLATEALRRLEWSGSWLDVPYRPGDVWVPPLDLRPTERRLRELADAFETLIESFEDEDPVRNANGIQAGSLAFAVVSDAASRLARFGLVL